MANSATVIAKGVLCFFRSEFSDFTLVDFFCLLDTETDGATEVFHKSLRLFHFGAVDFAADDGAEGYFGAEFLRYGECESCLSCSWSAGEEDGFACHFLCFD